MGQGTEYVGSTFCAETQQGKARQQITIVTLEEANALEFAFTLQIPVPRVHNALNLPNGTVAITMDYVDGECLVTVWPSMTDKQKKDTARQLQQVHDGRRYTDHTAHPLANEADFNDFILDLYAATPRAIKAALRKNLTTIHVLKFTHANLSPRNIIVANGEIVALVDWEYSGWYPQYWEYVKFFECETDCRDWKEYAEDIFDRQYSDFLVTFQAIARWQKP
ncbi:hypothetical protein AC578_1754 [Pseudocercospora eumusae]|uniref:Aminoglycoside phosphotransferase domain-containing protein n=1 Tax=Pseudocercospora eumusae TaxID=321146 RepID=A0A139GUU6_9PEZI|nr:hypothetical protein AC578_1754 [Pseudocercospora eumusae]